MNSIPGRLADRKAHYGGYRKINANYMYNKNKKSLDENPAETLDDPYRPAVQFPENARGQHGGRKRNRPANRGVNFSHVVYSA